MGCERIPQAGLSVDHGTKEREPTHLDTMSGRGKRGTRAISPKKYMCVFVCYIPKESGVGEPRSEKQLRGGGDKSLWASGCSRSSTPSVEGRGGGVPFSPPPPLQRAL